MSWNLFEKIINAVKPSKSSEQSSNVEQGQEVYSETPNDPQLWKQGEGEQSGDSQEQGGEDEQGQW